MSSERTALVCMERSEIGSVNPRKPIAYRLYRLDSNKGKEGSRRRRRNHCSTIKLGSLALAHG